MPATKINSVKTAWTKPELILFRVVVIYFFIQIIPLDPKFYQQLFTIRWSGNFYGDLFNLAHYTPQFLLSGGWLNWGIALAIAIIGAAIWTLVERKKRSGYDELYYWFRVLLRYRLAIALFAYGFIKFFPLQSPYPSISNLNTNYGDFNRWKLFSLSLGIVPSYQAFLGGVEIVLGLLLLFRKTASIAAFIVIVFTGNVFMSNLAYDGGETVYSLFLISLALFILIFDLKRIVNLLILQRPTFPNRFKPDFSREWLGYTRLALKGLFIIFFIEIYALQVKEARSTDSFQYPHKKGLAGFSGVYEVSEFAVNNDSIAYSKTDSVRWQDIVFEKWNTISIRSNRPVIPDTTNTDYFNHLDEDRRYELQGSGGRHYYSYTADTISHQLVLTNRNKNYNNETLVFNYHLADDSSLVLSGTDQHKDSLYAKLNKIDKKYLLEVVAREGRRKPLKL